MKCSVGIFLNEPCHKTTYGEFKRIGQTNEFEEDNKLLFQLRLNITNIECVCDYHTTKMLQKYNHLFGNCCSHPLLIHKKGIRNTLREITDEKYNEAKTRISDLSCATDSNDLAYEPSSRTIENVNTACQSLKVAKLSSDRIMSLISRKVEEVSNILGKKLSTSFDVPYVEEGLFVELDNSDEYSILINKLKETIQSATSVKDKIKISSLLPSAKAKKQ
ncbi:hypothetical protein PR048_026429 [Dryococelus australis]|uniref:Protein FAR1-RELATED SEQUENCE n=1 Tax=Dryococelus australis TaxID=614101 RepID=A0ABQ9GLD1_9NEOP|nr:hypothetical protein PR048_026429 [Dryococelus australis]